MNLSSIADALGLSGSLNSKRSVLNSEGEVIMMTAKGRLVFRFEADRASALIEVGGGERYRGSSKPWIQLNSDLPDEAVLELAMEVLGRV
jgi:hypothetical protein